MLHNHQPSNRSWNCFLGRLLRSLEQWHQICSSFYMFFPWPSHKNLQPTDCRDAPEIMCVHSVSNSIADVSIHRSGNFYILTTTATHRHHVEKPVQQKDNVRIWSKMIKIYQNNPVYKRRCFFHQKSQTNTDAVMPPWRVSVDRCVGPEESKP